MIVGDRDEALQIFDLGDGRRAPPRLAVRDHRHVPVARLHAVLARRPDRRRGGAASVLRPGRGLGLRRRHAAVERGAPLVVSDRARRPRRRAQGADARARARRHSDGARYWCNARLELLVAEGRYEDAVEAAEEYARRFARYHNPAAARWSSLRAVALDALGMKRKAIELAAEELDRARDWGAPGHGRALAARARHCSRAPKGSSAWRRRSRSSAARRRGSSWPSRSPRSASCAAAPAARTTRASR